MNNFLESLSTTLASYFALELTSFLKKELFHQAK
jgi:hypothetical protein